MGGGGGFVDFDGDGWLDIYLVSYSLEPQPGTGKPVGGRALPQQPRRHVHGRDGEGRHRRPAARHGARGRRLRRRRAAGHLRERLRHERSLPQRGRRPLPRGHGPGGGARPALGLQRHVPRLRPRRQARPLRLELPRVRPGEAGQLPVPMYDDYPFCSIAKFAGQPSVLFRNKGDGTFEDASAATGVAGLDRQGHGRRRRGPRRRRLDRRVPDERLGAELPVPQRRATGASARWASRPRWRSIPLGASRARWAPTRRTWTATAASTCWSRTSTTTARSCTRTAGGMRFADRGSALGLSMPTFNTSVYGARFLDVDNDGFIDLFLASGHPFVPVSKVWPGVNFRDPPFLFLGDGRRFTNVAAEAGEALRRPYAGRGVAVGDFDNDGDPDVLMLCMGEPPRLLRNDSARGEPLGRAAARGHPQREGRDRRARDAHRRRSAAHAGARRRRELPHRLGSPAPVRPGSGRRASTRSRCAGRAASSSASRCRRSTATRACARARGRRFGPLTARKGLDP